MDFKKVIAGIVLYNPSISRLKENIEAISKQVDRVILVDNGSKNKKEILDFLSKTVKNCKYIDLSKNYGIAYALNVILKYALDHSYEWFLTLDQDSVAGDGLIEKYIGNISEDVGIISCNIIDRNFKESFSDTGIKDIDFVITSGAMNNVDACLKVNGFDYGMFIDFVDFDLCAKLREQGYKIIRNYEASLLHELGNSYPVKILGKQYIVYNHSPMRVYYFFRNCTYFIRKHSGRGTVDKKAWNKNMLRHFILIALYEKNKIEKFKMIIKGLVDVKKMPTHELGFKEMEYNDVLHKSD